MCAMINGVSLNGKKGMLVKRRVRARFWILAALMASVAVCTHFSTREAAAANTAANTLKVTPVRSDVELTPGGKKTVKVSVTNLTKSPLTILPIENDFVAGDERGTPALILDPNQYAPTHSLKRFMAPLAAITIPANSSATVDVVITTPAGAQAGGYFGAIRFAPTTPDGGGQVNLSASVASLILATVPGPAIEKIENLTFDIEQQGKRKDYFNTPDNILATARFENKGNIQVAPVGKISVLQGKKVIYEADFNSQTPRDMVLPDSARRWDIPLKNFKSFGRYTVQATFSYGTKNQTLEATRSFWIIPTSLILLVVGGIILLIALVVGGWLILRGYKRRILRSNQRHSSRR